MLFKQWEKTTEIQKIMIEILEERNGSKNKKKTDGNNEK
jgi:hypothetical protein